MRVRIPFQRADDGFCYCNPCAAYKHPHTFFKSDVKCKAKICKGCVKKRNQHRLSQDPLVQKLEAFKLYSSRHNHREVSDWEPCDVLFLNSFGTDLKANVFIRPTKPDAEIWIPTDIKIVTVTRGGSRRSRLAQQLQAKRIRIA